MKKKPHWSQTPEGRKLVAKNTKARWAKQRSKAKPRRTDTTPISDQDEIAQIAYTLGWLEGWAKKAYPVIRRSRRLAATPMGQLILSLKGR